MEALEDCRIFLDDMARVLIVTRDKRGDSLRFEGNCKRKDGRGGQGCEVTREFIQCEGDGENAVDSGDHGR